MDNKQIDQPEDEMDNVQLDESISDDSHTDCEARLVELETRYKRALADYQNLEKRSREERGEIFRSANRELILRFLPIFDTLELAQQHEDHQTIKVIIGQFGDILKAEGVIKIKTVGAKFDPLTMEVISAQEGKEGVVIQEVRSGYLLHDKLLRPAQVIVGNGEKK